jgi:hypothetical protein
MRFRCDRCGVLRSASDAYYSPVTDMPVCENCYWEEEGEE